MIEDIKNILRKILENPDINFSCNLRYERVCCGKYDTKVYSVEYNCKDSTFTICPDYFSNKVRVYKNNQFVKDIECSYEDYLEISLIISKLNRIYEDKSYNEFIHSLD